MFSMQEFSLDLKINLFFYLFHFAKDSSGIVNFSELKKSELRKAELGEV